MRGGLCQRARKELFQRGLRCGTLSVLEIEEALPSGTLSESERWLLYYSLRALGVEIRAERRDVESRFSSTSKV